MFFFYDICICNIKCYIKYIVFNFVFNICILYLNFVSILWIFLLVDIIKGNVEFSVLFFYI